MKWLSLVLCLACSRAAENPISPGGVNLQLGMPEEAVLAQYALQPDVKLDALGPHWYSVAIKGPEYWTWPGSVVFQSGKLVSIAVKDSSSQEKSAIALVRALYTAVASGGTIAGGLVDVWTFAGRDANFPRYEVHLKFKDR